MVRQLFDFVGSISDRQTVYIVEIVLLVVCLVSTYFGRVVMSGSGTVLNKVYGKTNYFFATIKHILTAIGFLGMVLLAVFWLVDFIIHFFDNSLWYVFFASIAFGLWLFVFFKGSYKEIEKEIDIESKNINEIDAILDSNPIFSAAINILTKNPQIKTVRVYNNGIAFYKNDIPIPPKNEPYITGTSNSDVTSEIKSILKNWLSKEGNVYTSNGDIILKYEDFNFSNASVKTMDDIAKHLTRKLSPRYTYTKNEWTITFKKTLYSGGAYTYFNGRITENVSSKDINVTESATAYFSLHPSKIDVSQASEKANSKHSSQNYW